MRILLASPFFSQHWDSGHYWARAFSNLGHTLSLWDYRIQPQRPEASFDVALVMKGSAQVAWEIANLYTFGAKLLCYWPDAFGRDVVNEGNLHLYHKVFTPVRPTPEWMVWLPTGWDEQVHNSKSPKPKGYSTVFIGTNTPRKEQFVRVMRPSKVYGNGWGMTRAIYLHEYVVALNDAAISINLHRGEVGVNRRFFESMACTFTITDIVPGVEEILGPKLAAKVGFHTPEEGREKVDYFLDRPEEREELWAAEREAIKPYTYLEAAKRVLEGL